MTQGQLFPEIPREVELRVCLALSNQATSSCARAVLEVIRKCAGRHQAVTIYGLQHLWRTRGLKIWSDREVKAAVKELLEERDVPIGSARSGTPGYFLLCSPEDIDKAAQPIVGEIVSLAKRLRATDKNSTISRALCGQLGIE